MQVVHASPAQNIQVLPSGLPHSGIVLSSGPPGSSSLLVRWREDVLARVARQMTGDNFDNGSRTCYAYHSVLQSPAGRDPRELSRDRNGDV
jgi:hypothetical protein